MGSARFAMPIQPVLHRKFDAIETYETYGHVDRINKVERDQKYVVPGEVMVIEESERGTAGHKDLNR